MAQRKASPRAARAERRARRAQRRASQAGPTGPETFVASEAPLPSPIGASGPEPEPKPETAVEPTVPPTPPPAVEEPTTHAVLRAEVPRVDAAPPPPEPMAPEPVAATRRRGITWASQAGFAVATLGLVLLTYSFYYSAANYPANFNPAGMSGIRLSLGLYALGAVAGIVFLLAPASRPALPPLGSQARAYQLRASRALAGVGIGLTFFGLLLASGVYRAATRAGTGSETLTLAGTTAPHANWAALGGLFALAGIVLWVGFGLRAKAFADVGPTPGPARQASPLPAAAAMEAAPAARGGPSIGADVSREELHAMMRRIDSLLAGLPEDVVRDFSKSSEADTYLKLMRESEPQAPR